MRTDANVPSALRLGHEQLRAELVRATMESGPIGEAAKRLAKLCLPHFEAEEASVFPVLGLLGQLATRAVPPETAGILPLISACIAKRDTIESQHRSITSATQSLMQAAHREKNWHCAEFAYNLRLHENLEDEVIYPTLVLIGKYVRHSLGIGPSA